MSEHHIEGPQPFPDVVVDRRSAAQQASDRSAAAKQKNFFSSAARARELPGNILDILEGRREHADAAYVRFAAVPMSTGGQTLVVPGEVLLRPGVGNQDQQLADTLLDGFTRQPSVLPDGDSPTLETLLVRYVAPPTLAPTHVATTVDSLRNAGFAAAHTGVAAFQQTSPGPVTPPPPPAGPHVVVKMAEGPAPTTVTNDDLFLSDAQREPPGHVVVALVDTGISAEIRTDGWLDDVPRSAGSVDPLDVFPPPGNGKLDFAAGHGTFGAGIVANIEPTAEIRLYAALDSDGYGSEIAVADAMIRAVQDGAQVINLSLGIRTVDGQPPVAIQAALDAIAELTAGSVPPVFVAAAGNFGDDAPVYPAASPGVISVAALTADGSPAAWSTRGDWVTCSTIGEGVVSTYVEGTQDSAFAVSAASASGGSTDQPATFPSDAWAVWTGTSFAAPQIAGAIARTCRAEGLSPVDAAQHLVNLGEPIAGYGKKVILMPGTPTPPAASPATASGKR